MSRILYSGTKNASSWAFRAWLALREQQVDFDEVIIDLREPQRHRNLKTIEKFSPPGAVPVLVENESIIFDSMAIMEYANEVGNGSLLPEEIKQRARCRSLLSWQHSGLSGLCPKLSFESAFYSDKRAMTKEEIADAARVFTVWENELKSSGGPFLYGAISLADLAFVPTILRIFTHSPNLEDWPSTNRWIKMMLSRPSVREWMDEAEQLPPVELDDGYRA